MKKLPAAGFACRRNAARIVALSMHQLNIGHEVMPLTGKIFLDGQSGAPNNRPMKLLPALLRAALISYSRLPLSSDGLQSRHFTHCLLYLPAAGLVIGLLVILCYWLASFFLLPLTAAFVALAAGILLTGAIHEDGFADCCDGFGAGRDADEILRIMKDSTIGVYACLGLILLLLGKLLLLDGIVAEKHLQALLTMHVMARFVPLFVVAGSTTANPLQAKMSAGLFINKRQLLYAYLAALLALLLLLPALLVLLIGAALVLTSLVARRFFRRRLGGYNGDCLGASEQTGECLVLLLFAGFY